MFELNLDIYCSSEDIAGKVWNSLIIVKCLLFSWEKYASYWERKKKFSTHIFVGIWTEYQFGRLELLLDGYLAEYWIWYTVGYMVHQYTISCEYINNFSARVCIKNFLDKRKWFKRIFVIGVEKGLYTVQRGGIVASAAKMWKSPEVSGMGRPKIFWVKG